MRSSIPLNPILYSYSRHKTEVLDVLCHDCQTIMDSRSTNKDVETANLLQECIFPSVIKIDFTHEFILTAFFDGRFHSGSILWVAFPTTSKRHKTVFAFLLG